MSTYRKGLIGASISAAALMALAGTALAQQPLSKEEIEKRKAQQQQQQKGAPPPPPQRGGPPPLPPPQMKQVSPPPTINRGAPPPPPVVKRDVSPPVVQKGFTAPPPPPPVVKRDQTPPPPPLVKRETIPPVQKGLQPQQTPPPVVKRDVQPPVQKGLPSGPPPLVKKDDQSLPKAGVTPPPLNPPKVIGTPNGGGLPKAGTQPIGKVVPPATMPPGTPPPGTPPPGTPPPGTPGLPKTATPPPTSGGFVPPDPKGNRVGSPGILRPIGTPPPPSPTGRVVVQPPSGPRKLDEIKTQRVERKDSAGRLLLVEPGNRTIIKKDNRLIIHRDETKIIQTLRPDARTVRLPSGLTQTIYVRPDGVRVISEFDGAGRLIRRYGRRPGGPDIVYLDNRRFYRNVAIGVGVGIVGAGLLLALTPPVHALPRPKYIVDYDSASDDDLYEAMTAPPVVRLERPYSLDEIRYSQALRDRMRRVDLDAITFETASFEISEDQYPKLERMAKAIARAIEKNPAEMFLIEGHTDAVGSEDDNLTLSDRRAEAVARVLTEYYNIPLENLTTQGYGEQNLKVDTQGPDRTNRRVSFRRIGPLLGQEGSGN